MSRPRLDTLDDYDRHLSETLERWAPERRAAFAAGMAERWRGVYAEFAEREEWGDPEGHAHAMDAVWRHVGGRPMSDAERARLLGLLRESTPHMDDFDAPEALAAAVMVQEAVAACRRDNVAAAVQASMSGFEAILPDWSLDPEEQPRLWKRTAIRKEVEKQLALIERIEATPALDPAALGDLRRDLVRPPLVGTVPSRKPPSAPALRTNQALFEQYRGIIELDTRGKTTLEIPGASAATMAMLHYTEWASRYKRRHDILTGVYGPPADTTGLDALARRHAAIDRAAVAAPAWDAEVGEMIEMIMANPALGLGVGNLAETHRHGPSVRRLWSEAKAAGAGDAVAWERIVAWARHHPAVWAEEDRRKRAGRGATNPELAAHLAREVEWSAADDAQLPWQSAPDGAPWQVRLNDFPDDIMYTLLVAGRPIGQFHDWPGSWIRP